MLEQDRDELVAAFRSDYGRICTLVARALTQGHSQVAITEAACGKGQGIAPVHSELRRQRRRVNERLAVCKTVGITDTELIATARETRKTVESEWNRRIPMMA